MTDPFHGASASAPARHVAPLTPSNTADLADTPKSLYVGTGGDVMLVAVDAPAGALLPVRARRVLATGITAADMLVLL